MFPEDTKVTVRSAEVTLSQMIVECCMLSLDVILSLGF